MDTETSQAKIKKQNEEGGRSKSDQPTEKLKEGFFGPKLFFDKKGNRDLIRKIPMPTPNTKRKEHLVSRLTAFLFLRALYYKQEQPSQTLESF